MDEQLIIEIWDTFKDYIPEKSKEVVADQYVDFLLGKDVDLSELENILGYDDSLDAAIESVLEKNQEESDEDEESEDWNYDKDEE